MADRMKGIVVEIGGDTTGLRTALQGANATIATTQTNLKDINRLLKYDPKNTELLTQKQEQLAKAIAATKDKLTTIRTAADQAEQALELGKITTTQYDALQRELIQTEQDLKGLASQAQKTADKLDVSHAQIGVIGTQAGKVAGVTQGLTTTIVGVGAAALATIPATEEYRNALALLETNAEQVGYRIGTVTEQLEQLYIVTGDINSSTEAISNLLQAGFDENQTADAINAISGAVIAFPDTLKVESLADSIQETIATGSATGQFAELLGRMGKNADVVSDALGSMSTQAQRQNLVLQLLAQMGLSETYDSYLENNQAMVDSRQATIDLQQASAELAESVMPLVTAVMELTTAFVTWFTSIGSGGQTAIVTILALLAAISPVAGVVANITQVVGNASSIFTMANAKILLVVAAITILIGLLVAIATAWDDMSGLERAIALLGTVTAVALAAALAMGVFGSAATAGLAAVGIVAGIAAVIASISAAQSQAGSMQMDIPRHAKGAVIPANAPYLAMLGDQKTGTNIETPLSTMRQAFTETLDARGGATAQATTGGTLYANMQVDGVTFARLLAPYTAQETVRRGVSLVEG